MLRRIATRREEAMPGADAARLNAEETPAVCPVAVLSAVTKRAPLRRAWFVSKPPPYRVYGAL
jgi:hypothetical protein